MRRHKTRGVSIMAAAVFSVIALLAAAGLGQLRHEVTVTLKLIQVFVTDAKGKPALDLERSDFVLADNGKPQTITEFERHVLAVEAAARTEAATAPAPSAAPAAAPLLNRKFIFLIDYGRNDLPGVAMARKAAIEFLDSKVQKDDEIALFSFSTAGGLTLHEYLTLDHAKVRAAIKKMRDMPGISESGMSSVSLDHEPMGMELLSNEIFARLAALPGAAGVGGSRHLFADVAAWATALRAIPGQKNIIFFSRGFGAGVIRSGDGSNILFRTMARALASANAPVFSVNTVTDVVSKVAAGVFPEQSLDYLSQTTGGKYLGGVDYVARIASEIQDATANYYVLGYAIPASWDGKYHEVKVEVAKKGFVVHSQRGYFNPVVFAKLSPIEKHLQLLEAALGETESAKQAPKFPLAALQFAEGQGANTLVVSEITRALQETIGDRAEFVSLVLDENKAIVDGKRYEIDPKEFLTGKVFQYSAASLKPGRYDCRAVLRNLDDGRAAAGSCTVEVAAPPAEGPTLFPPLLLVRGAEAKYLNLTTPTQASGPEGFSFSKVFPFPAKEYVPLVGALEPGAASLNALLVAVWRGERGGEKELSTSLHPEGSEAAIAVTTECLSASSLAEKDYYLLRFEFPPLLPGRYRLEIRAEDSDTGSAVQTAAWLTIR